MAPSSPSPETHRSPSAAWLLCAACGPLSEEVANLAGYSLKEEPGLFLAERRYEVEENIPFPTLQRLVAADKAVQEALERVEAARSRSGGARKKRPRSHAELAGRARSALLLGKGKPFMLHYREYAEERTYEWHPDPEHVLFWERVLGPGWAGADAVPEGEARAEIVLLSASAFAFSAPPPQQAVGDGICGAPAGYEWLETAAALRAADAEALSALLAEESDAAYAAAELLHGRFTSAQSAFERLLGRTWDRRYAIIQLHGLPLLIYALVAGVLLGGSARHLRAWFEVARYALQYIFPPSMVPQQRDMMLFLDCLEQVDDAVNRNGMPAGLPQPEGALSGLPCALCYAALPATLRRQLNADALAEGVEELARQGMKLLAAYGAVGLQGAESLSAERRARLQALAGSLAAALPPPLRRAGERTHEALVAAIQKDARQGSSLWLSRYALPPTLVASCVSGGVAIRMMDREEQEEYDDSATLRCLNKYASRGQFFLEGADRAEYTRLFAAMQVQVEVVGNLARPGEAMEAAEPSAVLLLSHEGKSRFLAALRLRLLPDTRLLMVPAAGLDVPVLERDDGSTVAVRREAAGEWAVVEKAAAALQQAGCDGADRLVQHVRELQGVSELAELLRACRECGIECCWEQGHALRLHRPTGGLSLRCGAESKDWFELGGGLSVDEGRVLELSALLEAFGSREGKSLRLGDGEYVMLNPALERQLALLELVWQEKRGKRGVSAAALPLLEALRGIEEMPTAPPEAAALPPALQATLRPYQAEGFRWLAACAAQGVGALLADDMGLGKTVQVLAFLLHAAAQEGAAAALVVAPVSLLGNWAAEAARFAPSLRLILYDPKKPEIPKGLGAGALVLASYGQIAARQADFAARDWGCIVLDEAQAIKNPDSRRAKAVCALRAQARLCLTGTPIENNLLDLWSQMRFLNPGLFGTRSSFLRRFKKMSPAGLSLLRQVLAPLVLRRSKAEVLTQLPPLTESIEWVEFSREERALYESLRRGAIAKLGQGDEGASVGIGILAELMRLRRACCHGKLVLETFTGASSKLIAMAARVEALRAAGRRVLIFSQFTDVLDLAEDALREEGISFLRLDGSTPAAQRSKLVADFQEGAADAFLISLKAGGAGLNLTAADYVMLLDPWWNPAVEAQAAGRSHRMGQQMPVTLCRFMVRGTVEERIFSLHAEKKELAEQVLSGRSEALSPGKLRALLEE